MNIIVLKFGGSSISTKDKLCKVAKKVGQFIEKGYKVVTVLSAQGKMTDKLLKDALTLDDRPNKRDLDMLLSTGEQISCSKFSIVLNGMGYSSIALTGGQAGIITSSDFTNAKIMSIYTDRILSEFKSHEAVNIAGFQGIDIENNITTMGRNGSDITAVALAAALKLKECYIFTDVDGIYDKDPNQNITAKKYERLSYDEARKIVENGAAILHKRCLDIAEKYNVKINVLSCFNKKERNLDRINCKKF